MMRASSLHALVSISFFSSSSFLVCFCVFIPPPPIPPSFPAFLGRPGHQAQQRTAECRCGCRCKCDTPVAPEHPAASVGISSQTPSAPALFTQTPRLLINIFPQSQVSQAYRNCGNSQAGGKVCGVMGLWSSFKSMEVKKWRGSGGSSLNYSISLVL